MNPPLDYLKFHVPDEYARRLAIIKQGMQSATARSASKKRMLERMEWKKKKVELSDKYGI